MCRALRTSKDFKMRFFGTQSIYLLMVYQMNKKIKVTTTFFFKAKKKQCTNKMRRALTLQYFLSSYYNLISIKFRCYENIAL